MTTAEVAQVDYVADQIRLDDAARALPATQPLTARTIRNYARIAYRAAKAERENPDSPERMCGTCHGVRRCDIQAHRNRP
jgi:hypothetical protein